MIDSRGAAIAGGYARVWALAGAFACAHALAVPAPSGAQALPAVDPPGLDLPVVVDTLPNGLRVVVLQRPGAPIASFILRYEVGSVDEAPGESGIAHFLEHLLFKGTETIGTTSLRRERTLFRAMDAAHDSLLALRASPYPDGAAARAAEAERLRQRIRDLEERARELVVPAELDRILTEAGARNLNATTSPDATQYFVQLPANRAELWFVLEADRMLNPVFREFHAERDVVTEERRQQVESSGGGRLSEEFYAAAYRVHPYGSPVIGHMSDIESHTRERVIDFHQRHYVPANAVVAVVGAIDPDQVLRWARRYFGPVPAREPPPPVRLVEPPQRGERRVEVAFDAAPEVVIGWHVPSGLAPEAPAVAALAQILAGGRTSRLYRRLVLDDGLTSSVSFGLGPGFSHPRILNISAQPLTGRTTAELEAAIYDEIERLLREPPTDHEMQRIRNQLEAGEVYRLASGMGLAFQLAEATALYGDWRETFRVAARMATVTSDDVRDAARTYLTRENRTVGVLVRPGDAASRADGARGGVGRP